MSIKKDKRIRRGRKLRITARGKGKTRLVVHRSPKHIYAQIIKIGEDSDKVVASASTVEKVIKDQCKYTGNIDSAKRVGEEIAKRAKENGVEEVVFDRSGFVYHGRVKALADSARASGLKF